MTAVSPRVTVIMGIYNGRARLAQTLESLINQTEKNWTCVVVDDGSTDSSAQVVAAVASSDPRFQLLRHEKNLGLTVSLNDALASAQGGYVARQDVDDISHPDRLKTQADFLDAHPGVAIVGSAYNVIDSDGSPLSVCRPSASPERLARTLRKRNVLAHGSLMFRAPVLRQVGGYRPEFRMAQDYDLILRVLRHGAVASVPEALYDLRLVPEGGSLSRTELQNFFAELARRCAAAPEDEASQRRLILGALQERPPAVASPELIGERYSILKAVHLLKSGNAGKARRELSGCGDPTLKKKVMLLRLATYLPAWLRSALFAFKQAAL